MLAPRPEKVRAIGSWVLVRVDLRMTQTPSGIILPDQELHAEKFLAGAGVVLSVGTGTSRKLNDSRHEISVKKGDRILFRRHLKDAQPLIWKEDGHDYCFLHKADVLAKIPEDTVLGIHSLLAERIENGQQR